MRLETRTLSSFRHSEPHKRLRRAQRACEGAERGTGPPRATEPGPGAPARSRGSGRAPFNLLRDWTAIGQDARAPHVAPRVIRPGAACELAPDLAEQQRASQRLGEDGRRARTNDLFPR